MASLEVSLTRPPRANLPAPVDLSPETAMTLASELIAADMLAEASLYLIYALRIRPTAFGLCRMGKLCQRRGDVRDAARYYELALGFEPDNPWAVVGRASALSECWDATFEELAQAATPLANIATGSHLRPALFALSAVLRALGRLRSHPMLTDAARSLQALASSLPRSGSAVSASAYQERLVAALSLLAQLGSPASAETTAGQATSALQAASDVEQIEPHPEQRQLPPAPV